MVFPFRQIRLYALSALDRLEQPILVERGRIKRHLAAFPRAARSWDPLTRCRYSGPYDLAHPELLDTMDEQARASDCFEQPERRIARQLQMRRHSGVALCVAPFRKRSPRSNGCAAAA
jgi:hypothetical protein